MEIFITLLQSFHFNALHIALTALTFFIAGFLKARQRTKKMATDIMKLEKNILDLNAELLFGKTEAPVIPIKQPKEKSRAASN